MFNDGKEFVTNGPLSSLPSPKYATPGQMYYATDKNQSLIFDGDRWLTIATGAPTAVQRGQVLHQVIFDEIAHFADLPEPPDEDESFPPEPESIRDRVKKRYGL